MTASALVRGLAVLTAALCALASSDANAEALPRIRVGFSPFYAADVEPKEANVALRLWLVEVGAQARLDVVSSVYNSTEQLGEDFRQERLDLVGMRSHEYLRLAKLFDGELALASVRGRTKTRRDLVLIRADSGVDEVADLVGKRLALAPESEVGQLFLSVQLLRRRLSDPSKLLHSIERRPKASQAILAVFFGQADACIVSEAGFRTMAELNPQVKARLKVLMTSPDFVYDVTVLRRQLDSASKQSIVAQAMRLSESARGRQIMTLFRIDGLEPVTDRDLDPLRALLAEHERLGGRRR